MIKPIDGQGKSHGMQPTPKISRQQLEAAELAGDLAPDVLDNVPNPRAAWGTLAGRVQRKAKNRSAGKADHAFESRISKNKSYATRVATQLP